MVGREQQTSNLKRQPSRKKGIRESVDKTGFTRVKKSRKIRKYLLVSEVVIFSLVLKVILSRLLSWGWWTQRWIAVILKVLRYETKGLFKINQQFFKKINFQKKYKETRGRKRLPKNVKLRRKLVLERHRFLKRNRRWKKTQQIKINKIKQFFGLAYRRGRPRKKRRLRWYSPIRFVVIHRKGIGSTIVTISILVITWSSYYYLFDDLPSAQDLVTKKQAITSKILDRNGKVLFRIYKDENRTLVNLSRVSSHLVNATIAIEDKDYFDHHGFSISGIVRAVKANAEGASIQGGSTITQQLIKNRLLTPERTFRRKIRELILSIFVESIYTKEDILEMYLNQVAYGGATYGIEEAAWRYFNKSARELNLAESAMLAGLPAAPSVYSPFGSNPELAYVRQFEVLRRMEEDGYITPEELMAAKKEKLSFRQDIIDIKAPHFVMYVKKLLAEKFGEEIITQGGLEVRTSLDLDLQLQTEQKVVSEIERLTSLRVSNGAVLVTNPKTGEILAMVGSKDYFDFEHDGQVNVTLRPRQPGSAIKPLTYATALESGFTPATIINDSPVTYRVVGSPPYSPKNYDGKFHGRVSLRTALASSYNVPAVKTLAKVGIDKVIEKGEELGITTWKDRKRFGLSLTLGGGEVTMIDMAQVYSTFANLGYPVKPNPILEIRNYKGEVLYKRNCALEKQQCFDKQALDPQVAYLISDILSDNKARSAAFGLHSVLHIPNQQVAVKTGTTNSLRDNWTIGYTTDRLVAVWVGNNDNTPMSYVASGITGASPIWSEVMRLLLDEEKPHQFAMTADLIKVKICQQTGTLPCSGCPIVKEEIFDKGTEPKRACNPMVFRSKPEEQEIDKILQRISNP